jgi:hypothetical protein
MRTTILRLVVFGSVLALAVVARGGWARAAPTSVSTATATLTGGSASITTLADGTFAGALSGSPLTLYGASGFGTFTVVDDRGLGTGWSVSAYATQFTNVSVPSETIPTASLTMPAAVLTPGTGSSANPGYTAAAAIDTSSAPGTIVINTTSAGQGMGSYQCSVPAASWTLAVPVSTYAGTYKSTVTLTLTPR